MDQCAWRTANSSTATVYETVAELHADSYLSPVHIEAHVYFQPTIHRSKNLVDFLPLSMPFCAFGAKGIGREKITENFGKSRCQYKNYHSFSRLFRRADEKNDNKPLFAIVFKMVRVANNLRNSNQNDRKWQKVEGN